MRDKIIPTVGRIAKPILNVLGVLPGKIGMIGKIGSAVTGVLHQATDKIPNEQIRDKINKVVDKGGQGFQRIVDTGQNYAEKVNDTINRGREIVYTIQQGYNTQIRPAVPALKIGPKVM